MRTAIRTFISHVRSNGVAYVALFLALGGTSYAAATLPRGSVGSAQLRDRSVTPAKLAPSAGGTVRAWADVTAAGGVSASSQKVVAGVEPGQASYSLRWSHALPKRCTTTIAAITEAGSHPTETIQVPAQAGGNPTAVQYVAGYASGVATGTDHGKTQTLVRTFNQTGQPTALGFDVAVIC